MHIFSYRITINVIQVSLSKFIAIFTISITLKLNYIFSNESRELIRTAVNALEEDEVIFCDNPCERLAYLFNNQNSVNDAENINQIKLSSSASSSNMTFSYSTNEEKVENNIVLFVSSTEPMGNIKAWVDLGVQVSRILKLLLNKCVNV